MSIFDRFLNRKTKASLDSVSFDTTRYQFEGEVDGQRTWFTPEGDGIGLFFFPMPPDLPPGAQSSSELREFYRGLVCKDEVQMIEFRLLPVAGVSSIWMVLKIPAKPHGMTYLGSLTIPFAGFSFVVKMQCEEQGVTGLRETALFLKGQKEGSVTLGADGKFAGDWSPDDPRFDDMFPDHPLSRLRREFGHIVASLQIQEATKKERPFPLPQEAV